MKIDIFSKGKEEGKNEDHFGSCGGCFVLADGATDKSGRKYFGKTGGELVSKLVVREILYSDLQGTDLVSHLNKKVRQLYERLGILQDIESPKYRFTCGFVSARVKNEKLIITYLGDLGFRINGKEVYQEVKEIDVRNSHERAKYIEETGDTVGSREHIMPLLLEQFEYQNTSKKPFGYGVVDGTDTPSEFVKSFEYSISHIKSLELFSDGYFAVPEDVSIDAWEEKFREVEQEDPDKWIKYKSTKSRDDRTVMIVRF